MDDRLGLAPYMDILVTSNDMKITKAQGLFCKVLERFNIAPQGMVYVGDSMERDIELAMREGIMAVLYDEHANCRFDATERGSELEFLCDAWDLIAGGGNKVFINVAGY